MRMEKRNYVKPYIAVMNVQTEGVIAVSGDSGTIDRDKFCNSGCFDGSLNCGCYQENNNCNNIELNQIYCTTLHCNPAATQYKIKKYAIHYKLIEGNKISYWPCDKKTK